MSADRSSTKAGWPTDEWCSDTGVGRSTSYELEAAGKIKAVRVGKKRVITTPPREFLASLAEEQADQAA
jgi:excisionase family DNA binding protein